MPRDRELPSRETGVDMETLGRGYVHRAAMILVGGDDIAPNAAGPINMVVTVADCATTLLFPYVFHQSGFDTGIAISNTSSESGSCAINYHGAGGPDHHESPLIAGGGQLIFTLSSTVDTTGFQGYLVAVCDFRKAYGFASYSRRLRGDRFHLGAGLSRGEESLEQVRRAIAQQSRA